MPKSQLKGMSYKELQERRPQKKSPKSPKTWDDHELKFPDLRLLRDLKSLSGIKPRSMFGGLALYRHRKLLCFLCQSESDFEWKGRIYDFPIWNGLLICTNRDDHDELEKLFPRSFPHPVLGKWLMVRRDEKQFKAYCRLLTQLILNESTWVGVVSPKNQKKKKGKKTSKHK